VHEAKAKLSAILRQVKRGRSVTISERGRIVARVVPIERPRNLPSRLRQLEVEGVLVRRPRRRGAIRPLARRRGGLRRFLESRG
jgi:prevent-host-death family protein